jgi:hypothetical protein
LRDKIAKTYRAAEKLHGSLFDSPRSSTQKELAVLLDANVFEAFARDYMRAATVLERESPQTLIARLQLTGHAIELALKARLAAANLAPPITHDVVALYERSSKMGTDWRTIRISWRSFSLITGITNTSRRVVERIENTRCVIRPAVRSAAPFLRTLPTH